ncbi:MAG: transcriptional repressor NrdR [Candidatus Hydrogenedentes bacterium]|nr:transcriptional repressor NrdR [Candidatus Hydrogenedentota bacterium]
MRCPFCNTKEDKVVDSRTTKDGSAIRRRRECLKCGKRFTTYERVEHVALMVAKKDGRREPFDAQKIKVGVLKACEKRPIGMEQIDRFVEEIEQTLMGSVDKEVTSEKIGALVMKKLRNLDEVAYVRFASVYRQFRDINEFMEELRRLLS